MNKIKIKSILRGREDIFKLLAVGYVTGHPVLLEGPPGIGKTKAVLDFTSALFNNSHKEALKNAFILETDESTKGTAIKGQPNIKKLLQDQIFEYDSPITNREVIIINEVDKTTGAVRNSLLAVMNEKHLFHGSEVIPCKWKLFVGTCNKIPEEEINNPFWDRFVIKDKVSRLSKTEIINYCTDESPLNTLEINIPTKEDLDNINLNDNQSKLIKTLHLLYDVEVTDRSLGYVSNLIKAIMCIYEVDINKALVKVALMLSDYDTSTKVSKQIEPQEISKIRGDIELVSSLSSMDEIKKNVNTIESNIQNLPKILPSTTEKEIEELVNELNKVLNNNKHYTDNQNGFLEAEVLEDDEEDDDFPF